jgi:membrane carboxypeptidase/penicillin-binding protein PbpC
MLAAERRAGGTSGSFSHETIVTEPPDTVRREICALSGLTANAWCPVRKREWVAAEAPSLPCSWHHLGDEGVLTFWPAEYRQWATARGLHDAPHAHAAAKSQPAALAEPGGRPDRPSPPLTIVSPPPGATYLIDPTLRREFQTLPLRVVSATGGRIEWRVNGRVLGTADSEAAVDWPLLPGTHRIAARDQQGREAEATILVR